MNPKEELKLAKQPLYMLEKRLHHLKKILNVKKSSIEFELH